MDAEAREKAIKTVERQLTPQFAEKSHYEGFIKPFYAGNKYYLFIAETFEDIRLVGAPPSSIGKFGADADNWMWPRHTGDFALFRIYTAPDGKPAKPAKENVPRRSKRHLEVSLEGVKPGDFTMVFGFPGRTDERLPAVAVQHLEQVINPVRIQLRQDVLDLMDGYMRNSDKVRIQYASKQSREANAWKKWIGQNRGLCRLNTLEAKQAWEADFLRWLNTQPEDFRRQYANVLPDLRAAHQAYAPVELSLQYLFEALWKVELVRFAWAFRPLAELPKDAPAEERAQLISRLQQAAKSHFADYHTPLDHDIARKMLVAYFQGISPAYMPKRAQALLKGKFKGNAQAYADFLFEKSQLTSPEKVEKLLANPAKAQAAILKDPAWLLVSEVLQETYFPLLAKDQSEMEAKIDAANEAWYAALMAWAQQQNLRFYPDANSTLRVTYGKVEGYEAWDAVYYQPVSYLEGVLEKEDSTVAEFNVDPKLKALVAAKNYGPYADSTGRVPVAFIASNHTSGGNSGSAVLDRKGRLIGLNFDRNWEGTMSDVVYDASLVRNISVDARYILFVVDKLAGATHLVDEIFAGK
jgi:hypothetical protein